MRPRFSRLTPSWPSSSSEPGESCGRREKEGSEHSAAGDCQGPDPRPPDPSPAGCQGTSASPRLPAAPAAPDAAWLGATRPAERELQLAKFLLTAHPSRVRHRSLPRASPGDTSALHQFSQRGPGAAGGDVLVDGPGKSREGWILTVETPKPGAPHPPTMSISLVRELTRSETEECGSVLRSDSSCGGCPGAGAAFPAFPAAGNLREERPWRRGAGSRGPDCEGLPGHPLPADTEPRLCRRPTDAAGTRSGCSPPASWPCSRSQLVTWHL